MKKKKILIIDNEQEDINKILAVFSKDNFRIEYVDNLIAAREKILHYYYDYYFIDISVFDQVLINLIKTLHNKASIVIMSSENSLTVEKEIRGFGITYLLKKPINEIEIKNLIIPN